MFKNSKELVRKWSRDAGLFDWQVAELLGISVDTYSRKLRKELSKEELNRIENVINEYVQSQQERTEQHA